MALVKNDSRLILDSVFGSLGTSPAPALTAAGSFFVRPLFSDHDAFTDSTVPKLNASGAYIDIVELRPSSSKRSPSPKTIQEAWSRMIHWKGQFNGQPRANLLIFIAF